MLHSPTRVSKYLLFLATAWVVAHAVHLVAQEEPQPPRPIPIPVPLPDRPQDPPRGPVVLDPPDRIDPEAPRRFPGEPGDEPPAGFYGEPVEFPGEPAALPCIDLWIHDGQFAPNPVGRGFRENDNLETERGAFSVANKNDTDGDGTVDAQDDEVVPGERDEVDLIRLVLLKPFPDLGGTVELTLTRGGKAEADLALWRTPSKIVRETLRIFAVAELPLVLWLEGLEPSETVRDVAVRLSYPLAGCQDEARATFIWADQVVSLHDRNDDVLARFPDLTRPPRNELSDTAGGEVGLLPIESRFFRFFYRSFFEDASDDEKILENAILSGSRKVVRAQTALAAIVIRFTVEPPGLGTEDDIFFDITRQADRIRYGYEPTRSSRDPAIANLGPFSTVVRRKNLPPGTTELAIELPNDEFNQMPESRRPTAQDHLFTASSPGIIRFIHFPSATVEVYASNFLEFVRVGFAAKPFGNNLLGSRASPKFKWSARQEITTDSRPWKRVITQVPTTDQRLETSTNNIGDGHIVLPRGFPLRK